MTEEERIVVIRFGHDWDRTCMQMDELLYSVAEKLENFAVFYLVDITQVPDFNEVSLSHLRCTSCMIRAPSCSFIETDTL